jgi:hypothetical protein
LIKPESWFTLLAAAKQEIKVTAGDSNRGTFDCARRLQKDGKRESRPLPAMRTMQ